ncbi:MAG: hypothetical protein SFV17_26470, partial [Candidatus Obscuribacter sp.]|nr:hypothetical protein [Candidatus Obscuribacter sp.]
PLLAAFVLALFIQPVYAAADNGDGNTSVKANCSLDLPAAVVLTGTDNVTTVQDLVLNASNIRFDSELNAHGSVSIMWKGNSNSNNGFMVTVQRSTIVGSAGENLMKDLSLRGIPAPGGEEDATIEGDYLMGKALPSISESKPEQFCSTRHPGTSIFVVELDLNAPARDGRGTASTVLTFIGSAL